MNQETPEQKLRETAWRRSLTKLEQAQLDAWLATHPEAEADWKSEAALSAALAKLTEKPAPSNLTARVLAEIARGDLTPAGARKTNWLGWLSSVGWVPRAAVVVVLIGVGAFAYRHHRQEMARVDAATNIAAAAAASPVPPTDVLENFDEIFLMPPLPNADEALLAVMK
jgi:anti-sigma factor RsiW